MFSRSFMLLVVACIQRTCLQQHLHSEPLKDEQLTEEDRSFCRAELELNYPDVDVRTCMIIPQEFREKISEEWGPPQVRLATANTEKKYALMMMDPDAPSRTNPTRAYWRHWLLADIEVHYIHITMEEIDSKRTKDVALMVPQQCQGKGSSLRAGDIKGTLLSVYTRPTPPKHTGFHRYQFLVYEQPAGQVLSLSQQEQSSVGNWDPQAFVEKFGLVGPVASLQFLTQHFKD